MKGPEYENGDGQAKMSKNSDERIDSQPELESARSEVIAYIRERMTDSGADGVVIGMSGGVDSTLTTALAVEAVGSDNVLGLALPFKKTDSQRTNEAETIADGLGIDFQKPSVRPILDLFEDVVAPKIAPNGDRRTIGNVVARLRMICLYYAANAGNRIVVGTTNRSELLLGYFTKYGDGAADLYPIGDLYKTEVRDLADYIGLPRRIVYKDPTAGLWTGQSDQEDLGAPYEVIDPVLRSLVDRNHSIGVTRKRLDLRRETVEDIAVQYYDTVHKREAISTPGIGGRDSRGNGMPINFISET